MLSARWLKCLPAVGLACLVAVSLLACQSSSRKELASPNPLERALAVGKPILGICLGHQILALAVGADTYKLKFGHRSQNQPCTLVADAEAAGPRCYITTQNHGYAVREEGLPAGWHIWFVNANDGTVEGIRHATKPFYSVQFHPEAEPGPVDTAWIFDEFSDHVKQGTP